MRRSSLEGFSDRDFHLGGAVFIDVAEQPRRCIAQVPATLCDLLQQIRGVEHLPRKSVQATVLASPTLLGDKSVNVTFVFDLLAFAEGSDVLGDHLIAIENANFPEVGNDDQGASHPLMRDRIVVEVEPNVWGLARNDLLSLLGRERIVRDCEELGTLNQVRIAHAHRGVLWARAISGQTPTPFPSLPVEVVEVLPLTGREERRADILDGSLHPTLLVSAGHGHGARIVG